MLNRILSVIFPLVFAILFLRLGLLPIYEYYKDPLPYVEGKVVDTYLFLHKNPTADGVEKQIFIKSQNGDYRSDDFDDFYWSFSNDLQEQIDEWFEEKSATLSCDIKIFRTENEVKLENSFEGLKGYHYSSDSLTINDSVKLKVTQKYYFGKRSSLKMEREGINLDFYSSDLRAFENIDVGSSKKVYYSGHNELIFPCPSYKKFEAFSSFGALFSAIKHEWILMTFFLICSLICFSITFFNYKRGGQRNG
ncbi:MAG: hypothetical protein WBG46_05805 [Nonlabens sp.]